MKLSIVIPVYNVEAYVARTLESVFATEAPSDAFEVIVVNDGTRDRSMDVVRRFASRPNLTVLEQENQGLSAARMKGLSVAVGDYVWFVDSDDYLVEDGVGKVLDLLEGRPEVLMFPLERVSEEGMEQGQDFVAEAVRVVEGKEIIREFGYPVWAAQRFVMARSLFANPWLVFPQGLLHEDEYFGAVLMYLASSVQVVKAPVYQYRRSGSSITAIRQIRSAYDIVSVHRLLMDFLEQAVKPEDREWYREYCLGRLVTSYSHSEHLFGTAEFNRFAGKEGRYVWCQWKRVHPDAPLRKKMGRAVYFLFPSIRQRL